MFNPADIHMGMAVRDRDGERLGTVIAVDAGGFFIGKGSLFLRDYRVAFSDVMDIDRDDVYLREDLAHLPGVTDEAIARTRAGTRGAELPLHHDLTGGLGLDPRELEQARMDSARFQEHAVPAPVPAGGLGLRPGDLEQARMDSAKFQDHGRYDVGAGTAAAGPVRERRSEEVLSEVEPSVVAVRQPPVVVERRAARDDEDTVRRDAPTDYDPNTRH